MAIPKQVKDFIKYDVQFLIEQAEEHIKKYSYQYAQKYGGTAQEIYNEMIRQFKKGL